MWSFEHNTLLDRPKSIKNILYCIDTGNDLKQAVNFWNICQTLQQRSYNTNVLTFMSMVSQGVVVYYTGIMLTLLFIQGYIG
jgi:hypothetical protein